VNIEKKVKLCKK